MSTTSCFAKLSDLPAGISPFEKSNAKYMDVSGDFHRRALSALTKARRDGVVKMEIEFPPNLFRGKTSFDDFDNVQELDLNRDWCVEWLPQLKDIRTIWFLLPDLKECQLAKQVWTTSKYRSAGLFTTIEQVTNYYTNNEGYSKPWGANFADNMSKVFNGILGDEDALDPLSNSPTLPQLHLVCQPGNGGPVEDWINCEILHNAAAEQDPTIATVIVNGALDKVRDGYYPSIFFPKLAATVDRFYKTFESIFYLKPIADKGVYGWLYRSYPEPWQVVLQTVQTRNNRQVVENTVVFTSDTRPSYQEAVQQLLTKAAGTVQSL